MPSGLERWFQKQIDMKVLITGINGFLGQNLAKYFMERGCVVSGTTSSDSSFSKAINIFKYKIGFEFPPEALNNVDVIIHCAHSFREGDGKSNVENTVNLIRTAENLGIKQQIFVSSLSAREDAISEYGTTKFLIENSIKGIRGVIVVRPGTIIGNGGVFFKMIEMAKNFPVVPITIGIPNVMYLIGVDDLVRIIWDILQMPVKKDNFNLYYNTKISSFHLFKILKKLFKRNFVPVPIPLFFFKLLLFLVKNFNFKLPLSKDNLKGYITSQKMIHTSDIQLFGIRDRLFEEIIFENL
ncbi:MAG: NAD(P)-dependent oxidoreductase [Cytophagales bacterium]|nr:NAD(P)-dependent oxidoreductase [Cytophagales bacterium]